VGSTYQREERGGSAPLHRKSPGGSWAGSEAGPKRLPMALSIFPFISSFLFSVLYFFYNFCKIVSKPLKSNPKIFNYSSNPFKTVRN
jgi:hypothetical protein